jgi:hypothetical protein
VKAKPPAKLENINDEPNVAQSPLPRSGSVQQTAAANSHRALSFDRAMKFEYHPCMVQPAAGGCG